METEESSMETDYQPMVETEDQSLEDPSIQNQSIQNQSMQNQSIQDQSMIESEESDGDEVQLTLAQAMQLMEETWLNEKFAPEILPNKIELVECLLSQVTTMEENLESLSNTDFQKGVYQMEVDRLRFLISSYLRSRLEKIEEYVFSILKDETIRAEKGEDLYLTNEEIEFAKSYKEGIEQHFDNVLGFWPGLAPDDWKNEPVKPNMHSFVFLKSKSEIEGVVIDDGHGEDNDLVDFKDGSQMIMSYNSVAHLVKNGDVHLI